MAGSLTDRDRFCRIWDFQDVDQDIHWEAVGFWTGLEEEWRAAEGLPLDVPAMDYYGMVPRPILPGQPGRTQVPLTGPAVESHVIEDDGRTRVWRNDVGSNTCGGGELVPEEAWPGSGDCTRGIQCRGYGGTSGSLAHCHSRLARCRRYHRPHHVGSAGTTFSCHETPA